MKHRLNMEPSQASSIWPMPNISIPINIFKTINNRWFVQMELYTKTNATKAWTFYFFIMISNCLYFILEMCVLALTIASPSQKYALMSYHEQFNGQ